MVLDYFQKMIDDGRIIVIKKDSKIHAFIAFSVTDNPEEFHKKGEWNFKTHNPSGKIVYIEKLISKGWNRDLRFQFEEMILKEYPNLERGVWHRWARWGDRKTFTVRRIKNAVL